MNSLIYSLIRIIANTSNKPDDGKYHEHNITEPFRSIVDGHFGALIKKFDRLEGEKERFLFKKIKPRANSRHNHV